MLFFFSYWRFNGLLKNISYKDKLKDCLFKHRENGWVDLLVDSGFKKQNEGFRYHFSKSYKAIEKLFLTLFYAKIGKKAGNRWEGSLCDEHGGHMFLLFLFWWITYDALVGEKKKWMLSGHIHFNKKKMFCMAKPNILKDKKKDWLWIVDVKTFLQKLGLWNG